MMGSSERIRAGADESRVRTFKIFGLHSEVHGGEGDALQFHSRVADKGRMCSFFSPGLLKTAGEREGQQCAGGGAGLQAAALGRAAALEDARRGLRLAEGGEHWDRGGSAEGQGGRGGESRANVIPDNKAPWKGINTVLVSDSEGKHVGPVVMWAPSYVERAEGVSLS